jgi:hypothetical protein
VGDPPYIKTRLSAEPCVALRGANVTIPFWRQASFNTGTWKSRSEVARLMARRGSGKTSRHSKQEMGKFLTVRDNAAVSTPIKRGVIPVVGKPLGVSGTRSSSRICCLHLTPVSGKLGKKSRCPPENCKLQCDPRRELDETDEAFFYSVACQSLCDSCVRGAF